MRGDSKFYCSHVLVNINNTVIHKEDVRENVIKIILGANFIHK